MGPVQRDVVHLCEELVHSAKVALLGSIQQGWVPSQQIHNILVSFLNAEVSFFITNINSGADWSISHLWSAKTRGHIIFCTKFNRLTTFSLPLNWLFNWSLNVSWMEIGRHVQTRGQIMNIFKFLHKKVLLYSAGDFFATLNYSWKIIFQL